MHDPEITPITVGELIELLEEHPKEMLVVVGTEHHPDKALTLSVYFEIMRIGWTITPSLKYPQVPPNIVDLEHQDYDKWPGDNWPEALVLLPTRT